jgi:hypothetical protein
LAVNFTALAHELVALVKYVVVLVAMVAGVKYWTSRDFCKVDTEDRGMRPAIGNTRIYLNYDRNAWTERDVSRGEIVVIQGKAGDREGGFPFRVVAVGGDWLEVVSGNVRVNGKDEQYDGVDIKAVAGYTVPKTRVPRGYVFLMADNRESTAAGNPERKGVWRLMGKAQL